jgi:hypothetical protein
MISELGNAHEATPAQSEPQHPTVFEIKAEPTQASQELMIFCFTTLALGHSLMAYLCGNPLQNSSGTPFFDSAQCLYRLYLELALQSAISES